MRFAAASALLALALVPRAAFASCAQEWCPAHKKFEHCGVMKEHCIDETVTGSNLQDPTTWICKPSPASGLTESEVAAANDVYAKALSELVLKGKITAPTSVSLGGQIGTDIGTALGASLRKSIEASNARAQAERILAAERAQEEAAAKEKQHQETVASLRPLSDTRDETMSLRMGAAYDGNALPPDSGSVRVSTTEQAPLALRSVDKSGGEPIPYCGEWRDNAMRLRNGTGPTKNALANAHKVLDSATTEKRAANEEFSRLRREAAVAGVQNIVERYARIEARIRQVAGRDALELYRRLNAARERLDQLDQIGDVLRENPAGDPASLQTFAARSREGAISLGEVQAWAESPETQATAELLASFVPIAEVTLSVGRAGIDMTAAYAVGGIADSDRKKALADVTFFENQLRNTELQARDLENLANLYHCPQ